MIYYTLIIHLGELCSGSLQLLVKKDGFGGIWYARWATQLLVWKRLLWESPELRCFNFETLLILLLEKKSLEIIYYWTSGVPVEKSDSFAKVLWCSTNTTAYLPFKDKKKKKTTRKKKCLAYSRWTRNFQSFDCERKLSFICEVINYTSIIYQALLATLNEISVPLSDGYMPG
jgi:hypothetical protein